MKLSSDQSTKRRWTRWTALLLVFTSILQFSDGAEKDVDPRLKAPWVASIFHRNPSTGSWDYICGGTITSSDTVITSARCILPRINGEKLSSRPYHYDYEQLKVVAGLRTMNFDAKDNFTQHSTIGQIRDLFTVNTQTPDTPYHDLAGLRLRTPFNLSTPYVKEVLLTQRAHTILEANATKAGEVVVVAGFERREKDEESPGGGVTTRSKSYQELKIYEIVLTDVTTCINEYTHAYDAFYYDVFCGKSKNPKADVIPCRFEGAGMIGKHVYDNSNGQSQMLGPTYLFGVYSSNSALAVSDGAIKSKNRVAPPPCSPTDVIFFTQLGYLGDWGISHDFCGRELAMCHNNKCRPWEDLCSGSAECDDKSDESAEMCFNQRGKCMGVDRWRCKYGGCIHRSKLCNGILDCEDGSDEDVDTCSGQTKTKLVAGCPSIEKRVGVEVICSTPGRLDPFSCESFPVPVHTTALIRTRDITSTCTTDGVWSNSLGQKSTRNSN